MGQGAAGGRRSQDLVPVPVAQKLISYRSMGKIVSSVAAISMRYADGARQLFAVVPLVMVPGTFLRASRNRGKFKRGY
jgi:hypothetical protein